jgi:hypothetical protein
VLQKRQAIPARTGTTATNSSFPSAPSIHRTSPKTASRSLSGTWSPPPTNMPRTSLVTRLGKSSFTFGRDWPQHRRARMVPTACGRVARTVAPQCRVTASHRETSLGSSDSRCASVQSCRQSSRPGLGKNQRQRRAVTSIDHGRTGGAEQLERLAGGNTRPGQQCQEYQIANRLHTSPSAEKCEGGRPFRSRPPPCVSPQTVAALVSSQSSWPL